MSRLYHRYHKGLMELQKPGPFGPGTCHCCPDGGPFSKGKPQEPEPLKDPKLQALYEEKVREWNEK